MDRRPGLGHSAAVSDPVSDPPSFDEALTRLHLALADVANGDVRAVKALCARGDDASSFYGWGGYEIGWERVSARWDWAGRQFEGGTASREILTRVVAGELAYTTEIETFEVRVAGMGAGPTRWSNRVTHIFRLLDGEWRLIHRHANRLEDRYRPAPRLGAAESGPQSGAE